LLGKFQREQAVLGRNVDTVTNLRSVCTRQTDIFLNGRGPKAPEAVLSGGTDYKEDFAKYRKYSMVLDFLQE
jgi:hypothetical protein